MCQGNLNEIAMKLHRKDGVPIVDLIHIQSPLTCFHDKNENASEFAGKLM